MNRLAAEELVKRVRHRIAEGDCPVTPALSVETLENLVDHFASPDPDGWIATSEQIKHMVDRFLGWRLPRNLNPDGDISFKRSETAIKYDHPWPTGTNFLDAVQAEEMVRYMLEGLPRVEEPVALLQEYRVAHIYCKDLTGHPDAMPSQRKDWRCDLCRQADSYCRPLPTPPVREQP